MKKRIERMGRIEAAINPMYCVPKRSDLSLIGSAFEAAGFRCVRIRTECEAEHRTKGGDPRRHGMLVLDGDRVILEVLRSRPTKKDNQLTIPPQSWTEKMTDRTVPYFWFCRLEMINRKPSSLGFLHSRIIYLFYIQLRSGQCKIYILELVQILYGHIHIAIVDFVFHLPTEPFFFRR